MFGFMSNVRVKIFVNNVVLSWIVFFVKFFFYIGSNVFFNIEFFYCLCRNFYSILLYVFRYVSIFYYSFFVRYLKYKVRVFCS